MDNQLNNDLLQIKKKFEEMFPNYASRLEAATQQMNNETLEDTLKVEADIEAIQKEMIDRIVSDVKKVSNNDITEGFAIQLSLDKYNDLINAKGDSIETQLLRLMDSLERLKDIDKSDSEAITATILGGGLSAITAAGITYFAHCITAQEVLLPAAFGAVEFCTPAVIVGAVAIAIVLIIIPLIYFANKPAACILLVINELRQDLIFKDDKCVHGKIMETTKHIPKITETNTLGTFYSAGFFASQKKDSALIGTQYGLTLVQADIDKITFNFGVNCPLADGKNNCAVGCNQTSQSISEDAVLYQKQEYKHVQDGYEIDIKCNSAKGSVAYYIARVRYARQ